MTSIGRLFREPIFLLGLLVKFGVVLTFEQKATEIYYLPFLVYTVSNLSFDPWSMWLQSGGLPNAFLYGFAMWLTFVPTIAFSLVFLILTIHLDILFQYFSLNSLLCGPCKNYQTGLKSRFWSCFGYLNLLLATYANGFNDIIPVSLLFWIIRHKGSKISVFRNPDCIGNLVQA